MIRNSLVAASLLISSISFAEIPSTTCSLVAGKGPFQSFHYDTKDTSKMDVVWTPAANNEPTPTPETISIVASVLPRDNVGIQMEVDDWGGGNLVLGQDDDGVFAYGQFFSDSSEVSGYYRCK